MSAAGASNQTTLVPESAVQFKDYLQLQQEQQQQQSGVYVLDSLPGEQCCRSSPSMLVRDSKTAG
jgi:hypothetical protein